MSAAALIPPGLDAIEIRDEENRPLVMGELWRDRPLLLVLVRHFGCMFCAEQVRKVQPKIPELVDRGVCVAIVGTGTPAEAGEFRRAMGLDVAVYSDVARASYDRLGMHRGLATMVRPEILWTGARAILGGHRQRRKMGDNPQQGGVAVLTPDGTMPYLYRSRYPGDLPPLDELVRAATAR